MNKLWIWILKERKKRWIKYFKIYKIIYNYLRYRVNDVSYLNSLNDCERWFAPYSPILLSLYGMIIVLIYGDK